MKRNIFNNILRLLLILPLTIGLEGCFTGVEGTKTITLSKKDISMVAPTEEELYLSEITGSPLSDWKKGKKFVVADNKVNYLLEQRLNIPVENGDTLIYSHTDVKVTPDGKNKYVIVFNRGEQQIRYPVDKKSDITENSIFSNDLPMLIDLDLVEDIGKKLLHKRFWTRNSFRYGPDSKYIKGKKFVPVEIVGVEAGDAFFPIKIELKESDGSNTFLMMNSGSTENETRSFAKLFMLHDPRKDYKGIQEEIWLAIQDSDVRIGMTKEECRLSLGNPSDTKVGRDYSRQYEIWSYPDGSTVRFVDDIVIDFRKIKQ